MRAKELFQIEKDLDYTEKKMKADKDFMEFLEETELEKCITPHQASKDRIFQAAMRIEELDKIKEKISKK
jgi:hypothetical protein